MLEYLFVVNFSPGEAVLFHHIPTLCLCAEAVRDREELLKITFRSLLYQIGIGCALVAALVARVMSITWACMCRIAELRVDSTGRIISPRLRNYGNAAAIEVRVEIRNAHPVRALEKIVDWVLMQHFVTLATRIVFGVHAWHDG